MRRVGALRVVTAKTPENGDGRVHQVIPASRVAQGRAPRHGLRHDATVETDAYRERQDARFIANAAPQCSNGTIAGNSTGSIVVSSGQILSVSATVNSRLASPSSTSSASTNISPPPRAAIRDDRADRQPRCRAIASSKPAWDTALTALCAATPGNVRCTNTA